MEIQFNTVQFFLTAVINRVSHNVVKKFWNRNANTLLFQIFDIRELRRCII